MDKKDRHVLIVEDDDLMRDELSHAFSEHGYAVSTAKSGEEAIVLALEREPDLIILDIMLPRMSGLETLKKLRSDPEGERTPVLILSNLSNDTALAEAIEIGGTDYLLKADWTLDDVLKKVEQKFEEGVA